MMIGRVSSSDPDEARVIRLGIGVFHIDAFHQAGVEHRRFLLA